MSEVTQAAGLSAAAPAESGVTLTVIIATYNARDILADCLRSLYRHPPSEPYEVIVVDDASGDGTSEMVRAEFPGVRLMRNDVNRHYAFSNNRAMDVARGQYLLLLNNDTIVLPGALDAMVAFLRQQPDAGAVGCRLLNADGSIQWSVKSLPNPGSAVFGARSFLTRLFPHNRFSREHLLHLDRDMTRPFVAGYVSSAAVTIPREVAKKVGYLDVRLAYHVDADYCKRISDAGYRNYYLPTAAIVHLNHQGGTMVSFRKRFHSLLLFHVQSYIFFRKHVGTAWSPLGILAALGLSLRFVLSLAVQAVAELGAVARRVRRPARPTPSG
jgi:GT2 family glycosyltransferase